MGFLEKLKRGSLEEEKREEKKEQWMEKEGQLLLDMYETEEAIFIEAPIAGVKTEDIEIYLDGNLLTIEGERKRPEEERKYLIQECYWGRFSRKISLPKEANFEKAEATLKEGVLKIRIPKIKKAERKRIPIK